MINFRDLECLIALARHRHFAKAAAHCGLSQPAFSVRIRNLEEQLDTRVVKRGNRFQGLTAEGEAITAHARTILSNVRALEEGVKAKKGEIVGSLVIGVVPTSAAYAAQLANWLKQSHPGIILRVETGNSLAIQQGVDEGHFDAGITYTEGASNDLLEVKELYEEQYLLFLPKDIAPSRKKEISWFQAAELPLILLAPEMQNRRILDLVFSDIGAQPTVVAETDGFTAAVIMALEGMGATVIPRVLCDALGQFRSMLFLPLVDPVVAKSVCLVTPRRENRIPVVQALRQTLFSTS